MKWTCVNDGQTENGFFVIQVTGDRLRLAFRCKEGIKRTKTADGTMRIEWDGVWTWRWILDRKIPEPPPVPSIGDSRKSRQPEPLVLKAGSLRRYVDRWNLKAPSCTGL